MKWTDNLIIKNQPFMSSSLSVKIGDGFADSDSLYIKISDDRAFDIVNDKSTLFDFSSVVTPRDCEIIFH